MKCRIFDCLVVTAATLALHPFRVGYLERFSQLRQNPCSRRTVVRSTCGQRSDVRGPKPDTHLDVKPVQQRRLVWLDQSVRNRLNKVPVSVLVALIAPQKMSPLPSPIQLGSEVARSCRAREYDRPRRRRLRR